MKKLTTFLSTMLICFIATFTFILPSINAKADTIPVKLCYANYLNWNSAGAGSVYGCVKVKNLSYNKNIIIHYNYDNNDEWMDCAASYLKTDTDGYEVWQFKLPCNYFGHCYFAIKCEMNGQTYWDNNSGNNYLIDGLNYTFGSQPLFMKWLVYNTVDGTRKAEVKDFSGQVAMQNISYDKEVIVRYSTDDWKTYTDKKAEFSSISNTNTTEFWHFSVELNKPAKDVKYIIIYRVNGNEYLDNNFGSTYDVVADNVDHTYN